MMFKSFACFLFGLSILSFSATPLASEAGNGSPWLIMKSVMSADAGFITKAQHEEFWRSLKTQAGDDPQSLADLMSGFDQTRALSNGFSLEAWKSIKQSYEQRKVVRTAGFNEIAALMLKAFPGVAAEQKNNEGYLAAAANRTTVVENGKAVYVDKKMIDTRIAGAEAVQSRLERLFNPVWSDELQEQVIPEVLITILTPDLFSVTYEQVAGAAVVPVKAMRVVGPNSVEQIQFTPAPGADDKELDRRVLDTCEAVFRQVGKPCRPSTTVWRGKAVVAAAESLTMSGKDIGMGMAFIKLDQGLQVFVRITPGTAADAKMGLDDLMRRVKPE